MRGFTATPAVQARLQRALEVLDAVFPTTAERGIVEPHALTYPEDAASERHVDAIYRSWKGKRLRMSLGVFAPASPSAQDVFVRHSVRRLAYFVPALLADWVAEDGLSDTQWQLAVVEEAERRQHMVSGREAHFTDEELVALAGFFHAALDAALAAPAPPSPRWEEIDWQDAIDRMMRLPGADSCGASPYTVRATSTAESVVELACAYHVDVDPLLATWLADRSRIAEDALVALPDPSRPFTRPVWTSGRLARAADELGRRFFDASDPVRADALSRAEAEVRLVL